MNSNLSEIIAYLEDLQIKSLETIYRDFANDENKYYKELFEIISPFKLAFHSGTRKAYQLIEKNRGEAEVDVPIEKLLESERDTDKDLEFLKAVELFFKTSILLYLIRQAVAEVMDEESFTKTIYQIDLFLDKIRGTTDEYYSRLRRLRTLLGVPNYEKV